MDDTMDEAQRRRGGRGLETTHRDKVEIAMMAAAGDSKRAIARKTGRSRACIARVLKSEEVEALRLQARSVLDRAAPRLAENLVTASTVGASKGRFEGSYNALKALGVISEPEQSHAPRTVINIGQLITGPQHGPLPVVEWKNADGTYGEVRPLDVAENAVVVRTISVKPTDD